MHSGSSQVSQADEICSERSEANHAQYGPSVGRVFYNLTFRIELGLNQCFSRRSDLSLTVVKSIPQH